jgi:hypothetical protein
VLPLAINASSLSRSPGASWIFTFLSMPVKSHQMCPMGILCFERNTSDAPDSITCYAVEPFDKCCHPQHIGKLIQCRAVEID